MSREDPQLKLRLPRELRDRLLIEAAKNNRSINSEIVSQLQRAYGLSIGEREKAFADALNMLQAAVSGSNR